MKRLFIPSLLLCAFLFADDIPNVENQIEGGVELLRNGSFEETYGLEEKAALWKHEYKRTDEMALEGKFSAKCLKDTSYCEAQSEQFNVKPGTPFQISGFYNGPAPLIYAFFRLNDGSHKSIELAKPASIGKWSKFEMKGKVPDDAVKAAVLLRTWDGKTPVYFDSVHFFGISPVEPVQTVTMAADIALEVSADATPTLLTARNELEHYLPLVSKSITIGKKKLSKIIISIDKALDEEEAWRISAKDGVLTLSGGSQRGALYAVYHFLEDCLDIHWWTPLEESVPAARAWKFKSLSLSGRPAFFYRDIYRSGKNIKGDAARFAVRNRLNRAGDIPVPAEYGGSLTFGPPYFVHTFARYVTPDIAKKHPEFLSLVGGKRDGEQYSGQLCLTNPELRDFIADRMMRYVATSWSEADATGSPRPRFFALAQNDNRCFCECENCQKFVKETSLTDMLMDFVNDVAERVGEKYPEVLVVTSAYHNTTPPPKKIFPRKNVIIWLANSNLLCPDVHAPRLKDFRDTVEDWSKFPGKRMLWEYSLAHWPFPDDLSIQSKCQYYLKHNINSLFVEMSGDDFLLDCFDMKMWLYAKMMENPYADFEAVRQTFLKGHYGKAAPYVDKWRKLVKKATARTDTKKLNRHIPKGFDFFTLDELLKAHSLFDDAEKAVAGDKVLEKRLMRVRSSFNLLTGHRIARYVEDWKKKGGTADNFPIDRSKLAADMRRIWLNDMEIYKDNSVSIVQKTMEGQISIMENLGTEQHPVPEPPEFQGHKVQHFCPSTLTLHNNPNMSLIKDPDAREGCAYQILCTPRDQYFGMPFEAGSYNGLTGITTLEKKWDTLPKERGFQWLHMGKDHLHMKYYVYLTGSWELQATMREYLEMGEKDLDIWIRIKFEGPKFYPEDVGKENRIVVDSISFVEL